jgi:hypothetical protein
MALFLLGPRGQAKEPMSRSTLVTATLATAFVFSMGSADAIKHRPRSAAKRLAGLARRQDHRLDDRKESAKRSLSGTFTVKTGNRTRSITLAPNTVKRGKVTGTYTELITGVGGTVQFIEGTFEVGQGKVTLNPDNPWMREQVSLRGYSTNWQGKVSRVML